MTLDILTNILIFALTGIATLSCFRTEEGWKLQSGMQALRYFTILSNLLCAAASLLFVLTLTGLLNVGLNLFFVLVVRLSVEGVAIATAVSNAASAAILLWRLSLDKGPCRFSPRLLRFDKYALRDMIFIGIPAGIQGALF